MKNSPSVFLKLFLTAIFLLLGKKIEIIVLLKLFPKLVTHDRKWIYLIQHPHNKKNTNLSTHKFVNLFLKEFF